ncbi:hypothetical protein NDU88_003416 [Pleurodeles waltl]|uniref:Uncharacterized protein n=1 Tax=Pleurodeles waltl TaxID=8319 RepID=A0AAV7MQN7_PLEWA|nr:hypothetical protein NDU88_003416 [Pleurodeles waltl]
MADWGTMTGSPEMAQPVNLGTIMAELRSGFRALKVRFDTIESCIDWMKDRMDKQDTGIQGAEDRISNLNDGANNMEKRLELIED